MKRSLLGLAAVGLLLVGGWRAKAEYIITDLGSLDGYPIIATDINASGQVVGYSISDVTPYSYTMYHAFLYSNGTMTDLTPGIGHASSQAYSINNSGQVTGTAFLNGASSAFLYSNGTLIDLIQGNLNYTINEAISI